MSDMPNQDEAMEYSALLERVNPVFQTAKMTLFQLAANGNADAAMLAKGMQLTREATQDSANTTALPEQVLGGTIMLDAQGLPRGRCARKPQRDCLGRPQSNGLRRHTDDYLK